MPQPRDTTPSPERVRDQLRRLLNPLDVVVLMRCRRRPGDEGGEVLVDDCR